jgi:hypothetical protein
MKVLMDWWWGCMDYSGIKVEAAGVDILYSSVHGWDDIKQFIAYFDGNSMY